MQGTLLTIKEVGFFMNGKLLGMHTKQVPMLSYSVPVDVKDRDVFHITTEEYLLALTDLIEELVRMVYKRFS